MNFSDFDNVKREKANAMMNYHRLRKIAKLFRLLEIFIALVVFSWLSTSLPSVVPVVRLYINKVCVIIVSPKFVFFIGNAIIVTLFLKSGSKVTHKEETSLYEEFVKNSETRHQKMFPETEDIVFQDKETVCEEKISLPSVSRDTPPPSPRSPRGKLIPRDTPPPSPRSPRSPRGKLLPRDTPPPSPRSPGSKHLSQDAQTKSYRRSKSENIKLEIAEKPVKELRRSETEKCNREVEKCGKDGEKKTVAEKEKEMSNEEFQKTIEAFIAKQGLFRWEESMAIVVQNQNRAEAARTVRNF